MTLTPTQPSSQAAERLHQQRQFFASGRSQDVNFRLEQLKRLKQAIQEHSAAIVEAVYADLGRPEFEAYFEIAAIAEVNHAIKHLKSWVKPQSIRTGLDQFPSRGRIYPEPLGVVLIISPWNYPFQLSISPLVGTIAAGNCAIVKPSELSPHTSRVIRELIEATFDPAYISCLEGGIEISQDLLAQRFDHIFFTGSTRIGKIVMEAAAQHLTPVTLELGGKSPCIVDAEVNLPVAAKRLTWGKFVNAGQTCIAPDYILVDRRCKDELLTHIKGYIQEFFGENPAESPDLGRLVSEQHFDRLASFLNNGTVVAGGTCDRPSRYMAPTVLDGITWDDSIMQEEIFGPILPVLTYDRLDEAIAQINARPKPLALYIFSNRKAVQQQVLQQTSSGGACVNDTIMQLAVPELPFGGVGASGLGKYHGKASFDCFSHYKSVLHKGLWLDLNWRYAPYEGKLGLIKRVIGV